MILICFFACELTTIVSDRCENLSPRGVSVRLLIMLTMLTFQKHLRRRHYCHTLACQIKEKKQKNNIFSKIHWIFQRKIIYLSEDVLEVETNSLQMINISEVKTEEESTDQQYIDDRLFEFL